MLFFFEELTDATTGMQSIDVDLFTNNFQYLKSIDAACETISPNGKTYFSRRDLFIHGLTDNPSVIHSTAYKKYGHAGSQAQINIPDPDEIFTQFHRLAFRDDALVMLKYDFFHYLAIIIPAKLCDELYTTTNTSGNQNVNVAVPNPAYDKTLARQLQEQHIFTDIALETNAVDALQSALLESATAGTVIEQIVNARVSQGAFRRLLLLEHNHKCCLCNITTTAVLRASHIKGWSESSKEERMDSQNGLLLCANHDALFDRHLISFNPDNGELCISETIDTVQKEALNLTASFHLNFSERMKAYMKIHYQKYIK